MSEALVADHVLSFPYTRSTGPIIGAFLTGLRDGRILGIRAVDGRVVVPPQEYDPVTAAELTTDDLVEVADTGVVTTWSWNPATRPGQPLEHPFAWVLVRFEGADTPMLLALDCGSPEAVATGMSVRVQWRDERVGEAGDIVCVVPASAADQPTTARAPSSDEPITMVTTPTTVALTYHPGPVEEIFLRGTQERRLLGRQCGTCHKVYLPPRGCCSMCGADFTAEIIEVGQTGTVATFAVVNVPFAGQEVEIPYAAVEVLWDGAHITSQFLFRGAPLDQVRMGMRVQAIWKDGDLEPTLSNIIHVQPIDEPDASFESYAEYV